MFPGPPEPRKASRHGSQTKLAAGIAALVTCILVIPILFSSWSNSGSTIVPDEPVSIPSVMPIAAITDLDKRSRVEGKGEWRATLKRGNLLYDEASDSFSVEWLSEDDVISKHSEGQRGMELSELVRFGKKLYSFDDRTGIVFEVDGYQPTSPTKPAVWPRHILMEGDGQTDKGFKCEWATVKDGEMVVGSFGKEFTYKEKGEVKVRNRNNMWVKFISRDMHVRTENWTDRYVAMRDRFGYSTPGYLLHEAAVWDPFNKRWIFLPRRASKLEYDDEADMKRGTNLIITTDENFSNFNLATVGKIVPERGFSSAKLVPGSRGNILVALKSSEEADSSQSAFITVFTVDGKVLMPETEIPGGAKYEGVEFI